MFVVKCKELLHRTAQAEEFEGDVIGNIYFPSHRKPIASSLQIALFNAFHTAVLEKLAY